MKRSGQHVGVERVDPLGLGVYVDHLEQIFEWNDAVIASGLDHIIVRDVDGIAVPDELLPVHIHSIIRFSTHS